MYVNEEVAVISKRWILWAILHTVQYILKNLKIFLIANDWDSTLEREDNILVDLKKKSLPVHLPNFKYLLKPV